MALQQLRRQAPPGLCGSTWSRHATLLVVPRANEAGATRQQRTQRLNRPLVELNLLEETEPTFVKPSSFDHGCDFGFYLRPHPITLKQSQVGAAILVVSLVQAAYTDVAQAGFGGLLAAAAASALALWWAAPRRPARGITTQPTHNAKLKLDTTHRVNNGTQALMSIDPPTASAPPATEDLPATKPATAALTSEEAAHVAATLARAAFPNPKPAFVGLSVSMKAPGLFHAERIKIEAGTSTSSTVTPDRMEAGKQKLAEYLAGTTSSSLGLPCLDVPAGSSLEGVFSTKWASLLVHTVTPQDWVGGRAVTWGDLRVVAAYGVPLAVAELEEGSCQAAVCSAAAAEVPAVSESIASAAASTGVSVPCSGAVVAAVNAANARSMRRAGLTKLLGAVKLIMPLVVAAVAASSFADLV